MFSRILPSLSRQDLMTPQLLSCFRISVVILQISLQTKPFSLWSCFLLIKRFAWGSGSVLVTRSGDFDRPGMDQNLRIRFVIGQHCSESRVLTMLSRIGEPTSEVQPALYWTSRCSIRIPESKIAVRSSKSQGRVLLLFRSFVSFFFILRTFLFLVGLRILVKAVVYHFDWDLITLQVLLYQISEQGFDDSSSGSLPNVAVVRKSADPRIRDPVEILWERLS